MKKIKCKSPGCNKFLNDETHFENQDGKMFFPVLVFPTLKSVLDYYEQLAGNTYKQDTGINPKEAFSKSIIEISHLNIDDFAEDIESHTFGPIECWSDC